MLGATAAAVLLEAALLRWGGLHALWLLALHPIVIIGASAAAASNRKSSGPRRRPK